MGKGDEAGSDFHRRGGKNTGTTKNCSKTGKQKRGRRNAAYFWLGWLFCHALGGESKERGDQKNTAHMDLLQQGRHLTTNTGHWRHWAFKQKEIKRGELKQVGSNQNTGGD